MINDKFQTKTLWQMVASPGVSFYDEHAGKHDPVLVPS